MENTERLHFDELAHFSPRQIEAREASNSKKYTLYGGAMGGGKSYWLRWMSLYRLLKLYKLYNVPGIRVGLFCEDYPALKDRQISKVEMEFPRWLGTYKASDHDFILKPEYGSGVISFRNLDDASKYQSAEFADIGVDELTKNDYETFLMLRTRLRWPGLPSKDLKFRGGTNPGGPGHAWVKKMWLDGLFEPTETEQDQFAYVRALAKDNPHIDAGYLKSLDGLPDDKRRAFLEGDWDIFSGQYFTEWRKDLHVIAPHAIPPYARPFIALDYGYTNPSCALWGYKDHDDVITVYRELYVREMTYEALTKEILALTPKTENIEYWVCDPAIWSKKGETELSGADIMAETANKVSGHMPSLIKAQNDRVIGWNEVRMALRPTLINGKQQPRLQVFQSCQNLIRTLPGLVHDTTRIEDLDSDGEDHAADALRYMIMSNPPKNQQPFKVAQILSRPMKRAVARQIDFD